LSFEALSRGAESSLLFDRDPRAIRQCALAAKALGLTQQMEIRRGKVPACLPTEGAFELIFLDPPYSEDAGPVLQRLMGLLKGVLVLEHASDRPHMTGLECVDERVYGGTRLSFYRVTGADRS
jgi:16S rRNA G966 N2-methylase RsmD